MNDGHYRFERDPHNPYDSNALKIIGIINEEMMGHIPRDNAGRFSGLLDRKEIELFNVTHRLAKRERKKKKVHLAIAGKGNPGNNRRMLGVRRSACEMEPFCECQFCEESFREKVEEVEDPMFVESGDENSDSGEENVVYLGL